MKNLIQFVLISTLLAGVFGCSAESSERRPRMRASMPQMLASTPRMRMRA